MGYGIVFRLPSQDGNECSLQGKSECIDGHKRRGGSRLPDRVIVKPARNAQISILKMKGRDAETQQLEHFQPKKKRSEKVIHFSLYPPLGRFSSGTSETMAGQRSCKFVCDQVRYPQLSGCIRVNVAVILGATLAGKRTHQWPSLLENYPILLGTNLTAHQSQFSTEVNGLK
jgi:hypothetical protein